MNPSLTRHPGRSGRASARPRRAGICRAGQRMLQFPDSLAALDDGWKSLGFRTGGKAGAP